MADYERYIWMVHEQAVERSLDSRDLLQNGIVEIDLHHAPAFHALHGGFRGRASSFRAPLVLVERLSHALL